MKALRLAEPRGAVEIVDVEIPQPGPGEIRVRIQASGLCYTDVHLADGDWREVDALVRRPVVLGHEGVGIVEALGEGVTSPAIGQRVGVPFLRSTCGTCGHCEAGRENVCASATAVGMSHDGCHAEFVLADAAYVVPVPDALSSEQAAPLCCAGMTVVGALNQVSIEPGMRVAVLGVGGLGHLAVQAARARGAEVVAVDIDDSKLALAKEHGAAQMLRADDPETVKTLLANPCPVVVVTSVAAEANELATLAVAYGGDVLLCAVPSDAIRISAVLAVFKGVTYHAQAVATRKDLADTFDMAARGELHCEVQSLPLEAAPQALADLRAGKIRGRVVFTP